MSKAKELGQVFTPEHIVNLVLDNACYFSGNILNKKIIEPSFGNGAFLKCILERLICECRDNFMDEEEIIHQIEQNIYGIEKDEKCFEYTQNLLSSTLKENGIELTPKFNLYHQDALEWNRFGYFDFVVGNPPYVRIHNIDTKSRELLDKFQLTKGMADLYVVFYELGLKMLKDNGWLGFITPNSFFKNSSQKKFRKYLIDNNLIVSLQDFGSTKVFDGFDTYTCICTLSKDKCDNKFVYKFCENMHTEYSTVYSNDWFGANYDGFPWVFTDANDKAFLDFKKAETCCIADFCSVQHGFATNKDDVYIANEIRESEKDGCVIFNHHYVEREVLRKIVKASKYKSEGVYKYILFPYKKGDTGRYIPLEENELKRLYPNAYNYLLLHKKELEGRDMEKGSKWYQFARSQGLLNCDKKKLVINHIIPKDTESVSVYELPEDVFVYSGIFITSENEGNLKMVKDILSNEHFAKYAKLTGKNMAGGYKAINSKMIKSYRFN